MPGQFGSAKARPVNIGRRVSGHLLLVLAFLVPTLLTMSGVVIRSELVTAILTVIGWLLCVAVFAFSVAAALLWSTTMGGRLLGYRFVDSRTNQANGSMVLVKVLVQGAVEVLTLFLVTISYYFTYRDGQHWLDRAFNLVPVESSPGDNSQVASEKDSLWQPPRDVYSTSAAGATSQRAASAFAPPAYGGPASREALSNQQTRIPQPVAAGMGAGSGQAGFGGQQYSSLSPSTAPSTGIPRPASPVYPPTADPITPAPGGFPVLPQPAVSGEPGQAGGQVQAQRGIPSGAPGAELSAGQQESPVRMPSPARAAEPVRPPSPFTPQPSPFSSPLSPPQASAFQAAGPWAATSGAPVFPPVSPVAPARATAVSPAEPQQEQEKPVPAARAVPSPRFLQEETLPDDAPGVPDVISEVVLDDGLRIKVDGPLVLGRNPLAPDAYPDARSVQVTDETMRLSKTHLVLIPEGGHVQVIDIGATNGVYIEIDRERTRIPVHEPQRLAPGTLVHFGGRTLRLVS